MIYRPYRNILNFSRTNQIHFWRKFRLLRYNLASHNSLLLRATKPKHRTDTVYIFVHFSSNPFSLLNLTMSSEFRKPRKRRFQWYIVRTEIFLTFHARVEYISVKTVISGYTDAAQRWVPQSIYRLLTDGRKDGRKIKYHLGPVSPTQVNCTVSWLTDFALLPLADDARELYLSGRRNRLTDG